MSKLVCTHFCVNQEEVDRLLIHVRVLYTIDRLESARHHQRQMMSTTMAPLNWFLDERLLALEVVTKLPIDHFESNVLTVSETVHVLRLILWHLVHSFCFRFTSLLITCIRHFFLFRFLHWKCSVRNSDTLSEKSEKVKQLIGLKLTDLLHNKFDAKNE